MESCNPSKSQELHVCFKAKSLNIRQYIQIMLVLIIVLPLFALNAQTKDVGQLTLVFSLRVSSLAEVMKKT